MNAGREIRMVVNALRESSRMAFSSLAQERLRTFLSLLGISVGIFTIVSILTVVDSIQLTLDENLRALGDNVIYIQNYPLLEELDEEGQPLFEPWEYARRPPVSKADFEFLQEHLEIGAACIYFSSFVASISYGHSSQDDVSIYAVTEGMEDLFSISMESGRMISPMEYGMSSTVVVLGNDIARDLFPDSENPVGRSVMIGRIPVTVIGVMSRKGKGLVDVFDFDHAVLLPFSGAESLSPDLGTGGIIMTAPKATVDPDLFKSELVRILRSLRRLSPLQKNDFSLNEINSLRRMMDSVFVIVNLLGWFLAAFSLMIGGFGIANILFVSVQEKIPQIGIQKALGARNYVILYQYLVESSILSLTGGVVGILTVWGLVSLISYLTLAGAQVQIFLSLSNILTGLLVSLAIGLLAGMGPACHAALLDPVEAIVHN